MKLKAGGQLESFGKSGQKLSEIKIYQIKDSRSFELWLVSNDKENGLPDESLSYLTVDELLDLQQEIKYALEALISN